MTTRTQSFDSANNGWRVEQAPRSNIGWKDSINAGGSSGEGGGSFQLQDVTARYADYDIGMLTLDDHLHAHGKIWAHNQSYNGFWVVGWFSSNEAPTLADFAFQSIGAAHRETSPADGFRATAELRTLAAGRDLSATELLPDSRALEFEFDYDPSVDNA